MKSLALLLLLAAGVSRADTMVCDVSATMTGDPRRRQMDIGACHAFAAVSLVESAVFRSKGEKVSLSEADTYIVNTVARRDFLEKLIERHRKKAYRPLTARDFPEGTFTISDVRWILANGVARRATVPYHEVADGYDTYKAYMVEQLTEVERKSRAESEAARKSADAEIAKLYSSRPVLIETTRLLLRLHGFPVPSAEEAASVADAALIYLKAQELAASFWRAKAAPGERERQAQFLGPAKIAAVEKERAEIRTRYGFADMRVVKLAGGSRVGGGATWARRQICELGRPVGVDVDLSEFPEWQKRGKYRAGSGHAFVLTGVRRDPSGVEYFTVRNSWGLGANHDVAQSSLSKAKVVAYAVAAPGEPD